MGTFTLDVDEGCEYGVFSDTDGSYLVVRVVRNAVGSMTVETVEPAESFLAASMAADILNAG